jgi:hypothetical protein
MSETFPPTSISYDNQSSRIMYDRDSQPLKNCEYIFTLSYPFVGHKVDREQFIEIRRMLLKMLLTYD